MRNAYKNTAILTLSYPDKPGIVHAVSGLLLQHSANIAYQLVDAGTAKIAFSR